MKTTALFVEIFSESTAYTIWCSAEPSAFMRYRAASCRHCFRPLVPLPGGGGIIILPVFRCVGDGVLYRGSATRSDKLYWRGLFYALDGVWLNNSKPTVHRTSGGCPPPPPSYPAPLHFVPSGPLGTIPTAALEFPRQQHATNIDLAHTIQRMISSWWLPKCCLQNLREGAR